MSGKKSYFGILILFFLAVIIWTSYGMMDTGEEKEAYAVSVIVDDSNHDRWISLRQGLEQGAEDYQLQLNYVSTGKFKGVSEELALIKRELENGAKGMIVQMTASKGIQELLEQEEIILLESDVEPEDLYAYVGPDNRKMGEVLAEAVKEDFGGRLKEKEIGILCGNQRQLSMQQRLAGVQKVLEDADAEILWLDGKHRAQDLEISGRSASAEIPDIIVALGNDETEQMVDYLLADGGPEEECLLYGIGCSEKAVYYLDKGVIDTLVVPNEFNMGYQSMEMLADRLRYHTEGTGRCITDYLLVDGTNLYDADNQKVLFPIVQ